MGLIQRLVMKLVPQRMGKAMEAESRAWMIQCSCGAERSVWDAGGIRYRAAGEPRRWQVCHTCGKGSWHRVYYRANESSEAVKSRKE